MAQQPDVLIVGGGVIGLTTAYFLAREGARVAVLEQGDLGRQASWAGAGIIPPANPACARGSIEQLRAFSSSMYPVLSQELRERTGIDNEYLVCGGIELNDPGQPHFSDLWQKEGIAFEALGEADLRRLEPGLVPYPPGGHFLPGLAQVRNPRHLKALIAACKNLGVELQSGCRVERLIRARNRLVAVETGGDRRAAGRFLLASGAWADRLLEPLGWQPGVRPVRGQIVLFDTGRPGVRPVVLQGKNYLVPRADGRLLAGSTEEDAGFDTSNTEEGVAGLQAFALRLMPSLAEARVERCWAGLRPGSPDGLPFLGPVPGVDNLGVAVGHFRAGLQLSPGTGLVLKEWLLGQPLSLSLNPFRIDRPPAPPSQTAFRS